MPESPKQELLAFERCRCTCHTRGEQQGSFPHEIPCCVPCPKQECGQMIAVMHYYSHMQFHGVTNPTFPSTPAPVIEPEYAPQHD